MRALSSITVPFNRQVPLAVGNLAGLLSANKVDELRRLLSSDAPRGFNSRVSLRMGCPLERLPRERNDRPLSLLYVETAIALHLEEGRPEAAGRLAVAAARGWRVERRAADRRTH